MLEHTPAPLGLALRPVRAGTARLAVNRSGIAHAPRSIALHLPALLPDGSMHPRHTADGDGTSPAIYWDALPAGTRAVAILIEDADGPAPKPLLHAAAWNIDPSTSGLTVGALMPGASLPMARNSFGRTAYTPIDSPTGHGVHRYVFQLLALAAPLNLPAGATREQVIAAAFGRVLATGETTATYVRPASRDNGVPTAVLLALVGGAAYALTRRRTRRAAAPAEAEPASPHGDAFARPLPPRAQERRPEPVSQELPLEAV